MSGHVSVVEALLRKWALVDKACTNGATPLYIAAYNGHLGAVEVLLDKSDMDTARTDGATSLHAAARNGHAGVVKALLGKGANVDKARAVCRGGEETPVQAATRKGHAAIIEMFTRHAAGN
jgi:ankyrin repeat protein